MRRLGFIAGSLAPPLVAWLVTACSGETATLGLDEPIRVRGATLHEGDLPGSPPLTDAEVDGGVAPKKPDVTTLVTSTGHYAPGQASIP